jgi:ribosome maturation factor RimP
MITKEQVEKIITEKISGSDVFLVDVIIGTRNNIHVHLDTPAGISIDQCVEVSRYIVGQMDKDIEDYELEVSSPGLDAAFKVPQQYLKNIGKQVEITGKDGKKISAKLLQYSQESVEVEQMVKPSAPSKSKKPVPVVSNILLAEIKTIKSVVSFK